MGCLGVFFAFQILQYIIIKKRKENTLFEKEFKTALCIVVSMLFVSLIIQARNDDFESYLFEELLYFIVPPLTAYCCINNGKNKDVEMFIYIIFAKLALYFMLRYGNTISLDAIRQITFSDSNSSLYENVIAHDFMILLIVFDYLKKYKTATVSFVLCFLCFKRLPFLLSTVIFIAMCLQWFSHNVKLQKKLDHAARWWNGDVPNVIIYSVALIWICLPFVMQWIYSDEGNIWFTRTFNMSLNEYTSGRYNIVNYALENFKFNGLGSITAAFENSMIAEYRRVGNMHCDVIRLFKEVTIIGYSVYIICILKVFSKNRVLFGMLLYILLELAISHMADNLNIWTIMYLFAAYFTPRKELKDVQ